MTGPVGLKLWGPGGEIGRAGNIGLTSRSGRPRRGCVRRSRCSDGSSTARSPASAGLVTREAVATTRDYLDRFIADRLEEGWRAARGVRGVLRLRARPLLGVGGRAARVRRDRPLEPVRVARLHRVLPVAHARRSGRSRRRTGASSARSTAAARLSLRIPVARAAAAARPAMVGRDVARSRHGARCGGGRGAAGPPPSFGAEWIEAGLPQLRELVGSLPGADVWQFVDRERLQALLHGPPEARAASRRAYAARSRCCGGCTAATRPRQPQAHSEEHAADAR